MERVSITHFVEFNLDRITLVYILRKIYTCLKSCSRFYYRLTNILYSSP